jgi:carbon storage regulator
MLVLNRRHGEKIFIGKDITVTVQLIDRGKVRLGIEAPAQVKILRAELAHDGLAGPIALRPGRTGEQQP